MGSVKHSKVLGEIPDITCRSKEMNLSIFFPTSVVEVLRERCVTHLKVRCERDPGLTNGDVP